MGDDEVKIPEEPDLFSSDKNERINARRLRLKRRLEAAR